jgi:peptidoglycan hydrolase-like protein with peptidoglycan-binding domain
MAKEEDFTADDQDGARDKQERNSIGMFVRTAETEATLPLADAKEEKVEAAVEVVPPVKKDSPKEKQTGSKSVPTILTSDITVSCEKFVFESLFERNSRSVGVAQIRLAELGYATANDDKRGFLSVGTLQAIQEFAKDHGLGADNLKDEKLVSAIFAGTPVSITP